MNYQILASEIGLPQYEGMTDAEIVVALNKPGAMTRRRVSISDLQARAMESGIYTALRVAVGNEQAPAQLRAVAQTVLDLANARFTDVDLDNPASVQMFGVLQQAGVITAQQAAMIDALANVPGVSRSEELGLGEVVKADVARARLWSGFDTLRSRWAGVYNAGIVFLDTEFDAGRVPTWDDLVHEALR